MNSALMGGPLLCFLMGGPVNRNVSEGRLVMRVVQAQAQRK
jgi:hypothetical protein